ncbi:MAG: DUF4923 family protein [Alistipes sp.]|nr:DUF4923 family protein [Alistipes sp.]
MKKIFLMLLLLGSALCVEAQGLKGLLNAAKDVADEVTDGKASELLDKVTGAATEHLIVGTWSYAQPAMTFEGGDLLSNVAGEALSAQLSTKLTSAYNAVGIKPGACSFTFNEDNTFSAVLGNRTLSGTYSYDTATFAITLNYDSKLVKLGTMTGYAYITASGLDLVFDCTRLMKMLTTLGSKLSSLSAITSLMQNYDKAYIGFGLTKNK